eukprot:6106564-Amphidinium_carterae.2
MLISAQMQAELVEWLDPDLVEKCASLFCAIYSWLNFWTRNAKEAWGIRKTALRGTTVSAPCVRIRP